MHTHMQSQPQQQGRGGGAAPAPPPGGAAQQPQRPQQQQQQVCVRVGGHVCTHVWVSDFLKATYHVNRHENMGF